MTREEAEDFARGWAAAWNAHDIDRVLAHYADDFEMSSPFVATVAVEPSGRLRGKAAVGAYWRKALERFPDLRFEVREVFLGAGSVVIHYDSVAGLRAAEAFEFGPDGKVVRAAAHYDRP